MSGQASTLSRHSPLLHSCANGGIPDFFLVFPGLYKRDVRGRWPSSQRLMLTNLLWKKTPKFWLSTMKWKFNLYVSEVCYTPLGVIILRDSLLQKYK